MMCLRPMGFGPSHRSILALEQETLDLDVENKHKKNLKAPSNFSIYGVTTTLKLINRGPQTAHFDPQPLTPPQKTKVDTMHPEDEEFTKKFQTQADHDTKRCHHLTSSSTSALVNPSSSHPIDDENVANDEGTSRVSTPSPSRFVKSVSNDIPQIFLNPPNINSNMEPLYSLQTEILNHQNQLRDEHQNGLRSIERALKNVLKSRKK
ncbi:hypothetical protein Tco_1044183 [Tanacetum coccineum]|uniref:Uncharacterized protein n=1 Tax=Tanacetum coccineum TaxID=301880 RepID=A0ABQ5GP74_9ASTR